MEFDKSELLTKAASWEMTAAELTGQQGQFLLHEQKTSEQMAEMQTHVAQSMSMVGMLEGQSEAAVQGEAEAMARVNAERAN